MSSIVPDSVRHAVHPSQSKHFTTPELREHYLIDTIFAADKVTAHYTLYDRFMAGGAMPSSKPLALEVPEILKADFFLQRREMGIINVGATGSIEVDGKEIELQPKEALYIGMGTKKVVFLPGKNGTPLFYYNAAPAHHAYPVKKVSLDQAETVELGSQQTANQRTIRKLLISGVIETCQLQMGLTELKPGSVWNTMPPHTHDRRMEIYLYFNVPDNQAVCHFMGEPEETRPLWVKNHQAVISPPWSIHAGAGTSNYSFIWGMAGENLDYNDMDVVQPINLR
ncbi:MAG: 5-dehydro-4-deoxy-D-glucuronate isomerase [Cyclobacteriaceae bacterium]|nr:MAG: 5-dehydro-4-deoxy-D-glucuronate isomerase [Cyclobacteriaceae bacterium]